MNRIYLSILLFLVCLSAWGQELYPYADPASNVPAGSVSLKNTSVFQSDVHSDRTLHRHMQDATFGLGKKMLLRAGLNFANMHQPRFIWEGARLYAKYRVLSDDGLHRHFRMAAFAGATYSRNHLDHNEINLQMGDQSGVQAGLVATQLWNKFALSATGSWNEVLDAKRWDKADAGRYAAQAVNYSLSAGYLLLPFTYTDYRQTNINLYAELIGSRNVRFARETHFVDLMPSVQAIFNSAAKLNVSYRFQLTSDIYRLATNSWMLGFEYTFLNAIGKRRQR